MTSGEQVAFEPALAVMLAEHLHHAAVRRHVVVGGQDGVHRAPVLDGEDVSQSIRVGLIGTEQPEVLLSGIPREHVAHQLSELTRRLVALAAGTTDRDRVVREVRKVEVPQHPPAIDVRIGAHAAVAFRRECGERRHWTALGIEELLGTVALHPRLEAPQVLRVLLDGRQRYLMRSERAFDLLTIDHLRPRPSLGRAQDDRRPP